MRSATPRHRAERPRGAAWADLRRGATQIIAGRDLYADDLLLRPDAAVKVERTDDKPWVTMPQARRPEPAAAPA